MRRSVKMIGLANLIAALAWVAPAAAAPIPEIDPGTAQAGLTILVGGALVLLGWRRGK